MSMTLANFNFEGKTLHVFGTPDKPMFLAKEVGELLGLVNYRNVISTLDEDEKDSVQRLDSIGRKKEMTVVSESGLYHFIMRSDKPDAVKFRKWVRKEVLPTIRRTGKYQLEKQLTEFKERDDDLRRQVEEYKQQLEEAKAKEIRLNAIHKELLTYKKMQEKSESVYIVSNKQYAEMGIFKVGRTSRTMKTRLSGHNNTHIPGDKFKVLAEFKVNDCKIVENLIHRKLRGLLVEGEREFFMCPYNLLHDLVDLIVQQDSEQNETVNKIVDIVFNLKQKNFAHVDWTVGLDMNVFTEEIKLITDGQEVATFDVTEASEEEKRKFINGCIELYRKTIQEPREIAGQITWKLLQGFMIKELCIPKYKFKVSDWKESVKNCVEEQRLTIKWKNTE